MALPASTITPTTTPHHTTHCSAAGPHSRILAWFDVSQHMVRKGFSGGMCASGEIRDHWMLVVVVVVVVVVRACVPSIFVRL